MHAKCQIERNFPNGTKDGNMFFEWTLIEAFLNSFLVKLLNKREKYGILSKEKS